MFKRITDSKIIAGIKAQDDNILEWIYDNYYQTVESHIIKNSGSADDVPDVFQDTIIILYKQIVADSLRLSSDLKAYFFGIARNLWNVRLRQKNRVTGIEPRFDLADESDSEESEDLIFERIMSRAFHKLKADCQTILTLYSDGCSYLEIIQKMHLKNEVYARRKKYLCKEALLELVKTDSEYQEYLRFRR
ncbi:MAG: sigma-70 family RNA polymerase sigma factor [Bacteroidales bacterium]|nr:sigma-70 family RNA polymerase sigma factor [Bacteroidales bacterium]